MYSLCRISFEEIYDVWQTQLWPGRTKYDDINKISTLTIKKNKLEQQTYIKRYESTVVFFGLKYTSHYYKEKEETKTLLAEKSYLDVSCEEIVRVIVCVAEVARAEGILEMAKLIDVDSDDMLSTGMRLAAEGTEPELIVSILDTRKTERHKDVYYVCVCDSRHRAMCASPGQCRTQLSFLGAR